jgi:hypothetical protein
MSESDPNDDDTHIGDEFPDRPGPSEEDMIHQLVPRRIPEPEEAERDSSLPQFVTTLTPVEQQVGMHVITALQHEETVAVLTTVAVGRDGAQRVISVGLDPERLAEVQEILLESQNRPKKRVPCIGFHCRLEDPEDEEPNDPERHDDAS